jgi:hypothetical protein
MPCFDHRMLLEDERAAWKTLEAAKEAQPPQETVALLALQRKADEASVLLREHLSVCTECKRLPLTAE